MEDILVTGGTGIVGSALIRELVRRDVTIRASYRKDGVGAVGRFTHPRLRWFEGDLNDTAFCADLCRGAETVFHFASCRRNVAFHRANPCTVMQENIGMSLALAKTLLPLHSLRKVIFMSTANIPSGLSPTECSSHTDFDGYVIGKVASELLWRSFALQRDVPLLILRPVGVYGEEDRFTEDSNVIPSLFYQACTYTKEVHVWGDGSQKRPFVYVQDLVSALLLLLSEEVIGIQYISPPEVISLRELAGTICSIANPNLSVVCDENKPAGAKELVLAPLHPLLKDFPWTPLSDGLRRTYARLPIRNDA